MTTLSVDVRGRVAVVTGGSRGLGLAIASGLARNGASVVIASRNLAACEHAAAAIRAETGATVVAVEADVSRWDDCDRLLEATLAHFGRADILVNNAGAVPENPSITEIDESHYDATFDLNLKAPFRLSAIFGAHMVELGKGAIVNISSIGAVRPQAAHIPYSTAKAGLNVMTQGFAQAYGPQVRVNAIMAGPFLTDLTRGLGLDAVTRATQRFPLQRPGEPEEIVGAVLYLVSDAASYTTGTIMTIDGGRTSMA